MCWGDAAAETESTDDLDMGVWPDDSWTQHGACRSYLTDIFFPHSNHPFDVAPAKAICASCPVIDQCAEYALSLPDVQGVWGGMSEKDRSRARARTRLRSNLTARRAI